MPARHFSFIVFLLLPRIVQAEVFWEGEDDGEEACGIRLGTWLVA